MKAVVVFLSVISLGIHVNAGNFYKSATNNTYYIEEDTAYTWFEAFLECSLRRMFLLTIESEQRMTEIETLLTNEFKHIPPFIWIGAVGIKHTFTWISTGKPVSATFWSSSNPTTFLNNDTNCALVDGISNGLNNYVCDAKFGYVCQMDNLLCKECFEDKPQHKYRDIIFSFNQRN